jgi:hypothetical protein
MGWITIGCQVVFVWLRRWFEDLVLALFVGRDCRAGLVFGVV